jgi:erythromycin esterase-like protein
MLNSNLSKIRETITHEAHPFTGQNINYSLLDDWIGDARFVLIGEASHGTQEFYQIRAEITKQLILHKGFQAIAIEGDWPDAYQVNSYLHGNPESVNPEQALAGFQRFPHWMWRNTSVRDFISWLKQYNDQVDHYDTKIGFYGLDLYSLHASMEAVVTYLEKIDPEAAQLARQRYSCFKRYGNDPQDYGYATYADTSHACTQAAIEQLKDLQQAASTYVDSNDKKADEYFYALQNARLVRDAEQYYRLMFKGSAASWNARDKHMADTLFQLANHLEKRYQQPAKIVVWAHNSHVGDARATEMGVQGEQNIGQLVRQQYPEETYIIGFSTYTGEVTAASDWGSQAERKKVRPALPGSYEELFYEVEYPNFLLATSEGTQAAWHLREPHLQRAIGVIYRPNSERLSHYYYAQIPSQFDAIIHLDETQAVVPLDITTEWQRGEWPETYPSGY